MQTHDFDQLLYASSIIMASMKVLSHARKTTVFWFLVFSKLVQLNHPFLLSFLQIFLSSNSNQLNSRNAKDLGCLLLWATT
jgi:hypothetical protein